MAKPHVAGIDGHDTIAYSTTLGRHAFIGPGTAVTKDAADFALIVSNPGNLIGWLGQRGVRLPLKPDDSRESAQCTACGKAHQPQGYSESES